MPEFFGALLGLLLVCMLDEPVGGRNRTAGNVTMGNPNAAKAGAARARGPKWRARRDPKDRTRGELIAPNGQVAMTGGYQEMAFQAKLRNGMV